MTNKKPTKAQMYAQILSHLTDVDEVAFIEHEMELLAKKNATKSTKLTPTQEANEVLKETIVDFIEERGERMTISQMIKEIPACAGLSNQKVSALIRQLTTACVLVRSEEKGVAYFDLA